MVVLRDELQVINLLALLPNTNGGSPELVGEGEATSFLPISAGLMASGATVLGDSLIAEAVKSETLPLDPVSTIAPPVSKTSVFDSPAVVEIDSIVDSLAEDTATVRSEDENDALDRLFRVAVDDSAVGENRPSTAHCRVGWRGKPLLRRRLRPLEKDFKLNYFASQNTFVHSHYRSFSRTMVVVEDFDRLLGLPASTCSRGWSNPNPACRWTTRWCRR